MSEILLTDPPCRVRLNPNKRARRFTLRLEAGTGDAVLTVPPGAGRAQQQAFLARHAGWLRAALARQPDRIDVRDGVRVPIDGAEVLVVATDGPRRAPVLDGQRLVVQGPGQEGPRIAAWLKARARDRVQPAVRDYARKLGKRVTRISLRDTTSRWGSCSSRGSVSFSWRLAMAPPAVLDYVAAHEAAHLVEMNHSDRYWAVLARLMPDYDRHRAWLKREGRALHAYRFEGT